jgi:poly[(R)-3-hydroxyalkanoate] polymerase subunit PhaC
MGQSALKFDSDLMAWNADTTRMHSEYLRSLFLNNDLFEGRYQVEGRPVVLSDIRAPISEADHVAPWRSVYKINLVSDTDVTFVLTSGGHNAGIVSEPSHGRHHFRVSRRLSGEKYVDPDAWYLNNPSTEGSWWPVWAEWLERESAGRSAPPNLGAPDEGYPPRDPAPGCYVFER